MPRVSKKTPVVPTQKLSQWIFSAPLKFAFLALGLSILVFLVAFNWMPYGFVLTIISLVNLFAIYKLIRWLPKTTISQTDYVSIFNARMLISIIMLGIMTVLLGMIYRPLFMAIYTGHIAITSILILVLISLIGVYVFGLFVSVLYATYMRATAMGISPLRAALGMPFTILWVPAYAEHADKTASHFAQNRFHRLSNVITKSPRNTWVAIVVLIAISGLLYMAGPAFWIITLAPIVVYILWRIFTHGHQITDTYATIGAGINIALILYFILSATLLGPSAKPTATQHIDNGEQIEVQISDPAAE